MARQSKSTLLSIVESTDVEDATILSTWMLPGGATGIRGDKASGWDKGLSLLGAFLPIVSGSVIKKLGKGLKGAFNFLKKSGQIAPHHILFSQGSIRATFKDGTKISDLTKGFKNGSIDPLSVKPIRLVEKDGKVFSLDNRRLKAFQDANVEIPFVKLDEIPKKEKFKFKDYETGKTDGTKR